jgi:single-stranded DNA-specific DHH superfamily exonuclease
MRDYDEITRLNAQETLDAMLAIDIVLSRDDVRDELTLEQISRLNRLRHRLDNEMAEADNA